MADVCSDPDSRRFEEGYERPKWYYGVYDLGVHRDFQGRGVAKRMMELGIEKAQEESLPIYLLASPAGVPLYRRFGFLTVGKWTWWPKQTEGWDVMQWDPSVPASVVVGGRRKGVEWDFSVMVWRNTSEDGNILTT
jgi:GNAT superfamily N-acetyltransferase